MSRNKKSFSDRFYELEEAITSMRFFDTILDGEVVALDSRGRSSFVLLQTLKKRPLYFYVFDLLRWKGRSLLSLPLYKRKARLEEILKKAPENIRYSASLGKDVCLLLPQVKKRGLEGLIGKKENSLYHPGKRNGDWIKIKVITRQELVIGGYTAPQASRKSFLFLI